MTKILVSDPLSEDGIKILKDSGMEVVELEKAPTEDELCSMIGEYDGLIIRSGTKVTPIEKLISLYPLYHEMDYTQIVLLTNELVPYSYLDNIMKCRGVSSNELSKIAGIPISTINALRYKKRDINKFEAKQLLKIAHALDVKLESLLSSIDLIFDKVEP